MKLKVWWKGDLPLPAQSVRWNLFISQLLLQTALLIIGESFWQLYICGQSLTADRRKMAAQLLTVSALVLNDEFRVVIILVRNGRIIELEKRRGRESNE